MCQFDTQFGWYFISKYMKEQPSLVPDFTYKVKPQTKPQSGNARGQKHGMQSDNRSSLFSDKSNYQSDFSEM